MYLTETFRPKLRPIDPKPVEYEGMDYLFLRDPLNLSQRTVLVPQPLIPVLALCDGTKSLRGIQNSLALRRGFNINMARLTEMVETLDKACLLESEIFIHARKQALADFRLAPTRPTALAGQSYPETGPDLNALFSSFLEESGVTRDPVAKPPFRGLLSPHIDYQRGWNIYAQTWAAAAGAVEAADLAVIIGTDHFSEGCALTFTHLPYATPFGVLPSPTALIDELVQALGHETAFAGELHHRTEHSIELAACWLHYLRPENPPEMLPVLAGNIDVITSNPQIEQVIAILQRESRRRRVLIVAAGDLSHVGPAFGGQPFGPADLERLRHDDNRLLSQLCQGQPVPFCREIETGSADNNVCGTSPIYLMLRVLGSTSGQTFGYAACPADEQGTSFVTVAGAGLL